MMDGFLLLSAGSLMTWEDIAVVYENSEAYYSLTQRNSRSNLYFNLFSVSVSLPAAFITYQKLREVNEGV